VSFRFETFALAFRRTFRFEFARAANIRDRRYRVGLILRAASVKRSLRADAMPFSSHNSETQLGHAGGTFSTGRRSNHMPHARPASPLSIMCLFAKVYQPFPGAREIT
jgi:hypothetical protein